MPFPFAQVDPINMPFEIFVPSKLLATHVTLKFLDSQMDSIRVPVEGLYVLSQTSHLLFVAIV